MTIPVAHDFTCPWCWIGFFQVRAMQREFGVEFDWLAYELYPDELPWPEPGPRLVETPRPKTPTRLELAYAAQGMQKPTVIRPSKMRIHNAHEAMELAKVHRVDDELVERLYRAYWERGEVINDVEVLVCLSDGLLQADELRSAVEERRFKDKIVGFDQGAYATGVYNVPNFWIGQRMLAEQPYMVLQSALRRVLELGSRDNDAGPA